MVGRALTLKVSGIARVLHTEAHIFIPNTTNGAKLKAIWDTGATSSVITKNVSKALNLIPTGFAQVNTANGIANQNTFTVDVGLPNGVIIQGITVTEVDGLSGGCEALIGMDIITLGDFSITNHNGKTCMSFRVPSGHEIDYVTNPNYGATPIKNLPKIKNKYTNKRR
ncbi:retroviral-like aspartic protease family protein [Flavobacterium sp.]|uniref:retroviral-like aspartic protease family protein n=1 Tax=Flavobacterium sp. TaxID=239 RepID=UPI002FDCAD45